MTPEGLKLFKKALIGLAIFFVVAFGYRIISSFLSKPNQAKTSNELINSMEMELESFKTDDKNKKDRSAVKSLVHLLHHRAYNNYQSNRYRNAIYIWDTANYLDKSDVVVTLRLQEAYAALDNMVLENISLGNIDYKYLRYARAINHWQRAANLVYGIDDEKYNKIISLITKAKGQLKN